MLAEGATVVPNLASTQTVTVHDFGVLASMSQSVGRITVHFLHCRALR